MKKELSEKLCKDFPNLYSGLDYFGFECGDGWYDLIKDLSQKIEDHIKLHHELKDALRVSQVKEKFGGLRFYLVGYVKEVEEFINEAENLSFEICEICGKIGEPRKGGWIKTLCEEHHLNRWR